MLELPTVRELYSGKNIFITGGSGFIGKVLIEKLLRSCPDINAIYLLMREKKGKSTEERVKDFSELELFHLLKNENPQALQKIKIVNGDAKELNLGLSLQDQQMLIDKINIVFHGAASVRFDDSLTDAILLNTRGTREVVNLALQMKKLECFVHISTTYCNTDRKVIKEKVYPSHANWRTSIKIAESVDRNVLNTLTDKYIHPLPNTYTFTKSLSEHVVYDLCSGNIPTVIYRPSVVTSSLVEPIRGWLDGINSPLSLLTAIGVGLIRVVYGSPDISIAYVPVDPSVKAIILASWKQTLIKDLKEKLTVKVYNGSSKHVHNVKQKTMIDVGLDIMKSEFPMSRMIWYPNYTFCQYFWLYYIKMLFYQLLPAILIDGALRLSGKKPILVKLQRKIYSASRALAYFTFNEWDFYNDNALNLEKEMHPSDQKHFRFGDDQYELYDYYTAVIKGIKQYVLKEYDVKTAKRNNRRFRVAAQIFNLIWYMGLFWLIFVKFNIVAVARNMFNNGRVSLFVD